MMATYKVLSISVPELDRVIGLVAEKCDVSRRALMGKGSYRDIACARFLLIKVLRQKYDMSTTEIAAIVDRDHTTVSSSLRQFSRIAERDPFYKHALAAIDWTLDQDFSDLPSPMQFSEV
jgi:chromosomal replication initiation ATPase DnaA